MDHRCGRRIPLDVEVQLHASGEFPAEGWMKDVSRTGALIWTAQHLPVGTAILVTPVDQSSGFRGHVMRRDWGAIGVEWHEPDMHALCMLLAQATSYRPPASNSGSASTSRILDAI